MRLVYVQAFFSYTNYKFIDNCAERKLIVVRETTKKYDDKTKVLQKMTVALLLITIVAIGLMVIFEVLERECYTEIITEVPIDDLELALIPTDEEIAIMNKISFYNNIGKISQYIGCVSGIITLILFIAFCYRKTRTLSKQSVNSNMENELKNIKRLFEQGLISQEEYEAKKKQILGL